MAGQSRYILAVRDRREKKVLRMDDLGTDGNKADEEFAAEQKKHRRNPDVEIMLASAKDIDEFKMSYPRYAN